MPAWENGDESLASRDEASRPEQGHNLACNIMLDTMRTTQADSGVVSMGHMKAITHAETQILKNMPVWPAYLKSVMDTSPEWQTF